MLDKLGPKIISYRNMTKSPVVEVNSWGRPNLFYSKFLVIIDTISNHRSCA